MKVLRFYLFLFIILFFSVLESKTQKNIVILSYPKQVESYTGNVLNIPVVCENVSKQTLVLYPDYADKSSIFENSYQINRISPKTIFPSGKEIIFLSIFPDKSLVAGKRYFPFVLKDLNNVVVADGVIEINHIVLENFEIIPLSEYKFFIPNQSYSYSFLINNKGSVPVEFNSEQFSVIKLVQPGSVDTLNIAINETISASSHWYNLEINYKLTAVHPDDLKTTYHSLNKIIPVAFKTCYPEQKEFYHLPAYLSQRFVYDESNYYQKNISKYYRTSAYGSSFVDDFPSPFLSWYIDFRHDDYFYKKDSSINFYFLWKSEKLSLSIGENNYLLDLKHQQKYGEGVSVSYNFNNVIFEKIFLKEMYKDKPVHSSRSVTYTWDYDAYLHEPKQFIQFKHYQKNNNSHNNNWFIISNHRSVEHQKLVLSTQFKFSNTFGLYLELFSTKDSLMTKFSNPAFSTEATINSGNFFNRFYLLKDNIDVINESKNRLKFNNELSFQSDIIDIYTYWQYQDEHIQPVWSYNQKFNSHNLFINSYLNIWQNFYLRSKMYNTLTNITIPNELQFSESEFLYGLMFRNNLFETELLYGLHSDRFGKDKRQNHDVFELNFGFYDSNINYLNIVFSNRLEVKGFENVLKSQFMFFKRWTSILSHNFGIYNVYNSENDWKNYLSLFTDFFVKLPWNHDLKFGTTYNINPSFTGNYRFALSAEYSVPLSFKMIPKRNDKYMRIALFDPWQRKPVQNAVFEVNNKYYATNEAGVFRFNKKPIESIKILNLPDNFTTNPDIKAFEGKEFNHQDIQLVNFSTLKMVFKIKKYEVVSPNSIENKTRLAFYKNNIINLDMPYFEAFNDRIEVSLKNSITNELFIVTTDLLGLAEFKRLYTGEWEILFDEKKYQDNYKFHLKNPKVSIGTGEEIVLEVIVEEKYIPFTNFK